MVQMKLPAMKAFRVAILLLTVVCAGGCTSKTPAETPLPDPQVNRLTTFQQVAGAYGIIVPKDVAAYRTGHDAMVNGPLDALDLKSIEWEFQPQPEEPNLPVVRLMGHLAGLHVSPVGGIVEMELEGGVAVVLLQAGLEADELESAIAEPVVRETLLAFPMISEVRFRAGS